MASPSAGRRQPGLETMFGNFVNMLPLRARLAGNPSFKDFVKSVRGTLLTAMEHSDIPFPKLVEALEIPQTPSYTPVFQALVSLADEPLAASANASTGFKLQSLPTMVNFASTHCAESPFLMVLAAPVHAPDCLLISCKGECICHEQHFRALHQCITLLGFACWALKMSK